LRENRNEIATPTSQARNDNAEVKKETTEQNSVDVGAQSSARYSIDEKVFKIGKDIRKKSTEHTISLSLYVKMLIKNYG
jgi:hypothetical protein